MSIQHLFADFEKPERDKLSILMDQQLAEERKLDCDLNTAEAGIFQNFEMLFAVGFKLLVTCLEFLDNCNKFKQLCNFEITVKFNSCQSNPLGPPLLNLFDILELVIWS